jgi:hypothetical protein
VIIKLNIIYLELLLFGTFRLFLLDWRWELRFGIPPELNGVIKIGLLVRPGRQAVPVIDNEGGTDE